MIEVPIMKRVVVVVLMVTQVAVGLAVSDSTHLYGECIIKKGSSLKLETFKDSINLSVVGGEEKQVEVTVQQDGEEYKHTIKNISKDKWMSGVLNMTGLPQLQLQGRNESFTGKPSIRKGTKKTIIVDNEVRIVLGCTRGWLNRELSQALASAQEIPSSGNEGETLVLTPTQDTKVQFSVSEANRILCLNNSRVTVMDQDEGQQCGNLTRNTPVQLQFMKNTEEDTVKILSGEELLDNLTLSGEMTLKFSPENLAGTLYIAQCIESYKKKGLTSSPPINCGHNCTLSNIFLGIFAAIAVILFIIVIDLPRRLKVRYGNTGQNDINQPDHRTGHSLISRDTSTQPPANTHEGVCTENDVYESYDELMVSPAPESQ
ncbi:uncharacterized protein LOC121879043 isoform X2 [Homarus americanus]|uniref:uncharacterized protein LOC121879043 isoform X2 n=1 Tax=Homarus americanus TaxID=6706 RepID=UPI001C481400|nr:uncharacterized protein LOC121879043 isoform X2 [Homarus americanus]